MRAICLLLRAAAPVAIAQLRILLLEVQRVGETAAGEHRKRLLVEGVEAFHHALVVHVTPQRVEALQQTLAAAKAIDGKAVEAHVFLRIAILVRQKRAVCRAEETGPAGIAPWLVAGIRHEADERRHTCLGTAVKLAECRTHARPTAGGLVALGIATGLALPRIVTAIRANDRADDRKLVHHLRHAREQLADANARHVGGNFIQLTANFLRRVRLKIPHVLMRRAAGQEDVDHRFMVAVNALLALRVENLWQ